MKFFLAIFFINILIVVESSKLFGKFKLDSNLVHKKYNNKRDLGEGSDTSNTNSVDTSNTNSADTSNTNVADTSNTNSADTSNTNVADTSNTNSADTSNTNVADTSNTNVADTSNTNVADTSNTNSADTSNTNSADTSNTNAADTSNTNAADTTPTNAADTTPTNEVDNDTSEQSNIIPNKILLGFDQYTFSSNKLSFFSYIRNLIDNNHDDFTLPLRITRNLRLLEENITNSDASCKYVDNKNSINKFSCTSDGIEGRISKVEIRDYPSIQISNLAKAMGKNLQTYAMGDKSLQEEIIPISECKIEGKVNSLVNITGKNNSLLDKGDLTLYVVGKESGNMVEVPSTLSQLKNDRVQMLLRPKRSIDADLDGTLGKTKTKKTVYLSFPSLNSTEDDLEYEAPTNNIYRKKKSGLSTGGIIAIIIPCVLVLLAVAAVAFLLGRKAPEPPIQNINNTAGMNSSTNIVN